MYAGSVKRGPGGIGSGVKVLRITEFGRQG